MTLGWIGNTVYLAHISSTGQADIEATTIATELDDLRRLSVVAKNISDLHKGNSEDSSTIKELETELLCAGTCQTAEDAKAEYDVVKRKLQASRQELELVQQQITQTASEVLKKHQIIQSLRDKHSKLQNDSHRLVQLGEQISETEMTIQNLTTEIQQHEAECQDVKPELERLNKNLLQSTAEGQAKEEDAQQVVAELQKNFDRMLLYNKDLER